MCVGGQPAESNVKSVEIARRKSIDDEPGVGGSFMVLSCEYVMLYMTRFGLLDMNLQWIRHRRTNHKRDRVTDVPTSSRDC